MIEGIIVDAGHGGIDSGAIGNNLLEKEIEEKIKNNSINQREIF